MQEEGQDWHTARGGDGCDGVVTWKRLWLEAAVSWDKRGRAKRWRVD